MFGKFFKSKKKRREFDFLNSYKNRDKYFVRTKPWDWLNEKEIYLPMTIGEKPTMITLDFWSQEIYLDATGQITVAELVDLACKQYTDSNMDIPEELDKALIESLESLVNELHIVDFTDGRKQLPDEIELPISRQMKQ
jgi:hypothetical protein